VDRHSRDLAGASGAWRNGDLTLTGVLDEDATARRDKRADEPVLIEGRPIQVVAKNVRGR
jgi:hypothetical protein